MVGSLNRHWPGRFWRPTVSLRDRTVPAGPWFIVRKSGLIGTVAAAKVIIAVAFLGVDLHPAVLGVTVLAAITVYLHNDATDVSEDAINRSEAAKWIESHTSSIRHISLVLYLAAVTIASVGGLAGIAVTLLPAVAAIIYSEPWIPGSGANRLKEVPILNTVLVAAAWAVPIVLLPLTVAPAKPSQSVGLVCGFLFLRTVTGVEVMNVRDVAGDRAAGVETLPVCVGVGMTKRILWSLDLATSLLVVAGVLAGHLGGVFLLVFLPVVLYSGYVTSLLDRGIDSQAVGHAKDAEYLLLALGVLFVPGAIGI